MEDTLAIIKGSLLLLGVFLWVIKWLLKEEEGSIKRVQMHLDFRKEIRNLNQRIKKINEEEIEIDVEEHINNKIKKTNEIIKKFKKNYRRKTFKDIENVEKELGKIEEVLSKIERKEITGESLKKEAIINLINALKKQQI